VQEGAMVFPSPLSLRLPASAYIVFYLPPFSYKRSIEASAYSLEKSMKVAAHTKKTGC
jgi:hypothetical protein